VIETVTVGQHGRRIRAELGLLLAVAGAQVDREPQPPVKSGADRLRRGPRPQDIRRARREAAAVITSSVPLPVTVRPEESTPVR